MKHLIGKAVIKKQIEGKCIFVEQISKYCLDEIDSYLNEKVVGIIDRAVIYLKATKTDRLMPCHIRQAIKDVDTPVDINVAQKGFMDLKRDYLQVKDDLKINEQRVTILRRQNEALERRLSKYESISFDAEQQ